MHQAGFSRWLAGDQTTLGKQQFISADKEMPPLSFVLELDSRPGPPMASHSLIIIWTSDHSIFIIIIFFK